MRPGDALTPIDPIIVGIKKANSRVCMEQVWSVNNIPVVFKSIGSNYKIPIYLA